MPDKYKAEEALDGYLSAARKEELSVEAAMIRIARSDAAIARAGAAIARQDWLLELTDHLLAHLAKNAPRKKT